MTMLRPALAGAAPGREALAVAQARMHDRQRRLEPCAKPRNELRRERDLGHEHQRLLAALQDGGDRPQVDLGLAAAGHAIEQVRCEASERSADPLHGLLLRVVQGRAAARRRRRRLTCRYALRLHDVAARFQFAQRFRRALGRALQIGRRHLALRGKRFDDRAQAYRARLQLSERFAPPQLGERPHDGLFSQRRAEAQRRWHGSRDDLADRMAVVVRRPKQQLQEPGVEGGFLVDRFECGAQLVGGHVGVIAVPDNHADHAASPERHPHPMSRREIRLLGRRAVVEQSAAAACRSRPPGYAAPRSMHRTCGQVCALFGVKRLKCCNPRTDFGD